MRVFKFRAAWIRFCSWCPQKVHILLPLACDLNLVITSEASRVVNSCSFMGIILFPYFNSTKGVKKTMASGNSRIRSSISPIWLDCSIRVYLNFALCDYTSRHLIDTYSSFCVVEGGDIFSHSHVLLFFFFFFAQQVTCIQSRHWRCQTHLPNFRPIYVFNSVVNSKLPAILSHRRSTTVSLETYSLHLFKIHKGTLWALINNIKFRTLFTSS